LHLTVGKAVLDDDILADVVTETSQALIESLDEMRLRLPGPTREVAYPVNPPCRLLRVRGKRPGGRRTAENGDEIAPSHATPNRTLAASN
jgi:hypothetical protein